MAKPRAATLQQRFGFLDDDLKTPKHDEIMIWLNEVVVDRLAAWLRKDTIYAQEEFDRAVRWAKIDYSNDYGHNFEEEIEALIGEYKPIYHRPDIKVKKPVWEHPIATQSRGGAYTIGFIDMAVRYTSYDFCWKITGERFKAPTAARLDYEAASGIALFEIKSSIPSLGELLRQIRMYQQYVSGSWFVVSPDDRFRDQIEAQGIGFIKYQAD